MIALVLALVIGATPSDQERREAANWQCADPIIAKNYSRPIDDRSLAARIADECARPYAPPTDELSKQAPSLMITDRAIYDVSLRTFTLEISARILRLRRHRDIPLRR